MEKESTKPDNLEPDNIVKENSTPAITVEQEGRVETTNIVESIDNFESSNTMDPSDVNLDIEMKPYEHKDLQYTFIMGHKRAKNPGKLIVGGNERFICAKLFQEDNGIRFYYVCSYRAENKCWKADQCSASLNVDTSEGGEMLN